MTIKVLIVDDSTFFRKRLTELLSQDAEIEVIGEAVNGEDGVSKTCLLKPDVVTMDVEMPVMNGIEAVREIMKVNPVPVLMFSSVTIEGAQAAMDALDAGAADFTAKNFDDIVHRRANAVSRLIEKVKALSRVNLNSIKIREFYGQDKKKQSSGFVNRDDKTNSFSSFSSSSAKANKTSSSDSVLDDSTDVLSREALEIGGIHSRLTPGELLRDSETREQKIKGIHKHIWSSTYQLLLIGCSTGGPVAVQQLISGLPDDFPVPIIIVQHMPAAFISTFVERLNLYSKLTVHEAVDADLLLPGNVYVAPGGKQLMMVKPRTGGKPFMRVIPSPEELNYRPCIDVTFGSAARVYGSTVLAMVLTGMGCDGFRGSQMLVDHGSVVWAQDEKSSVIYGMPKAVAGLAAKVVGINEAANDLVHEFEIKEI